MKIINKIFDRKGAPILMAGFVVLFLFEKRRQLRRRTQPAIQRTIINTLTGIPAFVLLRLVFLPAMVKTC